MMFLVASNWYEIVISILTLTLSRRNASPVLLRVFFSKEKKFNHRSTVYFNLIQERYGLNSIPLVPGCLLSLNGVTVGNVATDAVHVGGVHMICQIFVH